VAPPLEHHHWGGRVVVRRPDTGRWTSFPLDSWERHTRGEETGVALALARTGLTGTEPLGDLVPCRLRSVLTLPERPAFWAPDPLRPTPGGHAWRALPAAPDELALWAACNDVRTLDQAARLAGLSAARALEVAARWTRLEHQLATLRSTRPSPHDPSLWLPAGPPRPAHVRSADQAGSDGRTTLEAWHHEVRDGSTHFDRVETTVAHALARPHPVLGGQPYGARLRRRLRERGLPVDGPVVEVGCGDGELARDWAPEAPWLRVDLSPALLATQGRAAPHTSGVLADGTRLPLRDRSVGFLLSNEVLADLTAVPSDHPDPQVDTLLAGARCEPSPPGSWHNLGAMQLVVEVARVLAPGGAAVLTEFGSPDETPTETVQLDHPEVSIRFDHLVGVARAHGLVATLSRLDDLLGADLSARHLTRPHWEGVRALWASRGVLVPARAWCAADVPLPEPVEGLVDEVVTRPGPGPLLTRFWALELRRGAAAG
jgi:SAM-dependent methyltransferase